MPELPDLLIPLDPSGALPLHRQVYEGVRNAILSGQLGAGARIPSTRRLAQQLSVSRSTVLVAFEQLVAEGYLDGAVGSGSYVARRIPGHVPRAAGWGREPPAPDPAAAALSARGEAIRAVGRGAAPVVPYPKPFWLGVPPVDAFPIAAWSRLAARQLRSLTPAQLQHGPAAGHAPLREMIAAHLAAARGMRCDADQVIVLTSAQEALELVSRLLLDPGDAAWIEDPGWVGARGALVAAGASVVPVPVDGEGIDVARGIALAPHARVAYVTPSHQFPLGVTLSLERRMALLRWAAEQGSWILEDDYDSEYRYAGRPLSALHALDDAGRVLYIGTFNKTLFPALRIGYLVAPRALAGGLLAARRIGGQHASPIDQAVLAEFISSGGFARHLRRSRAAGRERRDALVAAAARHARGLLEIGEVETGLHTVAWLPAGSDDARASEAAARHGIQAAPLSAHHAGPSGRPGLVLGYAGVTPRDIDDAMRRLAQALSGMAGAAGNGPVAGRAGPADSQVRP